MWRSRGRSTRFGLLPFDQAHVAATQDRAGNRFTAMSRLWFLDFDGPRPDSEELNQRIESIRAEVSTAPGGSR